MDRFILSHTERSPQLHALRKSFVEGDPASLLCIEFYADDAADLPPRLAALERDLAAHGFGTHFYRALDAEAQARIWTLREAALGLSMAMKTDEKSLSFVEDAAVPPERLRDYIARLLEIVRRHETTAGVYAHASVGCLHVRPVVNLKTADGVRRMESIANEVAELVVEFGGALSGEHGDGMLRSPFMRRMYGPALYEAFRTIKRTFDPHGIFNPGKIVDAEPMTANLRFGAGYETPRPATYFDYGEYGGMAGAVEMCSGLGACRKTLDGTMCPSYMATREEADVTRGRANVLRLAMAGRLGEAGLGDEGVYRVLDLCLECRACKAECPVGVDVARFKSEFLADYWSRHGLSRHARLMSDAHRLARIGSRFAPLSNWIANAPIVRRLNETVLGVDRRRRVPPFAETPLERRVAPSANPDAVLFTDTFTNYYDPEIGLAALRVLGAAGLDVGLAGNVCCGRPKISKGVLDDARALAAENVNRLYPHVAAGRQVIFCEPSCLSAVREDAPDLLRGEAQRRARTVAAGCVLFEEAADQVAASAHVHDRPDDHPPSRALPSEIDGTSRAGKVAAVAAAGIDRRGLERGLLRHGRLVRLRPRALRDIAGDCGTSAAAGDTAEGSRHGRRRRRYLVPAPGARSCRRNGGPPGRARRRTPRHSRMSLATLSLVALLVAILASTVTPLNVGVLALAFAWGIALYGGIGLNDVLAGFPVSLFLTLAGVTLLFTQAQQNGTLTKVAERALRLCRGNAGLVPVMFFVLGCTLASVGPGHIATTALIAPMAMTVAARARIPAFLMAIMVGHGATAGSLSPVAPTGIIVSGIMTRIGLPGHEWSTYANNLAAQALVAFAGYFIFGGWRLFRSSYAGSEAAEPTIQRFDSQQLDHAWRHRGAAPRLCCSSAQTSAWRHSPAPWCLSALGAADHDEAIKKMPWSVILMVSGVTVLIALLEKTQGLDLFTSLLARWATPATITGFIAFVAGLVSVYSSTSGVVLPAFLPTVPGLIERLGGGDPVAIASAMNVGAHLVDVSPLSTIGALCIAGLVPGTEDPRVLFNRLLAWGLSMTVVGAVACYLLF